MGSMFASVAVAIAAVVAFSVLARPPEVAARPAITDILVVDYLRMETDNDPKFPVPSPVHVLSGETVEVLARTRGIQRLDILVQLSGTETFGVFSGQPDRNGIVKIEVKVPAGGSMHDFRVPGPESRRVPGQVQPRAVFMLQPTGVIAGGFGVPGDAIWVRIEE